MEDWKCFKCSTSVSNQKPCRVCGSLVCFPCVFKKVAPWKRGKLKTNWWCKKCSKANKENVAPNVAQERLEEAKCQKCGNQQPVSKVCTMCDRAALYFCVGDDCWEIDPHGATWLCYDCAPYDKRHNSSSRKYAITMGVMKKVDGELKLERERSTSQSVDKATECEDQPSSFHYVTFEETLKNDSLPVNSQDWELLEQPVEKPDLSADRILGMPMDDLVELVKSLTGKSHQNQNQIEDTMQPSVYAKLSEETTEEGKEEKNTILVEKVEQFLTNLREDSSENEIKQHPEGRELSNGHEEGPLDCVNKQEEIPGETRVVLDHVLDRCLYLQNVRTPKIKSDQRIQQSEPVDKNEKTLVEEQKNKSHQVKAVQQSSSEAKTVCEDTNDEKKNIFTNGEDCSDTKREIDEALKHASRSKRFFEEANEDLKKHKGMLEDWKIETAQEAMENQPAEIENPLAALLATENDEANRTRTALFGMNLLQQIIDVCIPNQKQESCKETTEPKPLGPVAQVMNRLKAQTPEKSSVTTRNQAEGGTNQPPTTIRETVLATGAGDRQMVEGVMDDARYLGDEDRYRRLKRFWEDWCKKK